MKQLTIMLMMMIAWMGISSAASGSAAEGSNNAPAIEFKKKTYDFGTIKEADGKVTCEFAFTNTGTAPLVIISANAGCGCTTPEFDDQPIAPGAKSAIKVTYNPHGRPGEFVKNITVRTNAPKQKKVILRITGLVVPK